MAEQQPIANDPNAFLSAYVTLEASRDALMQLSGAVAAYMQEQQDSTVGALYLAAGESCFDFLGAFMHPLLFYLIIKAHVNFILFSVLNSGTTHAYGHARGRLLWYAARTGIGGMFG